MAEPGANTAMSSVLMNLEFTATDKSPDIFSAPVSVPPTRGKNSPNVSVKSVLVSVTDAPALVFAFNASVFVAAVNSNVGLL